MLRQPDKQEFHLNSFHMDFSLPLREEKNELPKKPGTSHWAHRQLLQGGTGIAAGVSPPASTSMLGLLLWRMGHGEGLLAATITE